MELKIFNPTEDGFIKAIEWNHEEIKKEVAEKVEHYKNLVYTDDQIKEAKADRATLNKFVKALEDKRKEVKKQCLAPYEDFEAKMKEILAVVNEPIALIGSQITEYEEKQKADKKAAIEELFGTIGFQDFVTLQMVWDEKWLNATTTMKKIEEAMKSEMCRIGNDIFTLQSLPEFGFEATEIYKKTLDVNKAIAEAQRMAEIAKQKAAHEAEMKARAEEQARLAAEAEAKKQEEDAKVAESTPQPAPEGFMHPPVEEESAPAKQWISFSALLSTEDALALRDFLNSKGIEFKAI